MLGRTGRGLTEHQNVDAAEVDMIIGSLAGPLCTGGGFCAGSEEIVEHQRISAAAYTFSAALPAMLATTASEVLLMLQTNADMLTQVRDNIKTMWAQLDPRSDWVNCTSSIENPTMLLVLKPEVIASRKLSTADQEQLLQDAVDEVRLYYGRPWIWTNWSTELGERGSHHQTQEHASSYLCHCEGYRLGAPAGAESVHYIWIVEEGDRTSRNRHQACNYQGGKQEKVTGHRQALSHRTLCRYPLEADLIPVF